MSDGSMKDHRGVLHMFAIHTYGRTAQRAICLFFSAVIVSTGLMLGALGAQAMERDAIAAVTEARA
jgi:hypothetical protein